MFPWPWLYACITSILLLALTAPARGEAISVASIEAPSGEEAAVPISLKQATSVGAMHVELRYDPAQLEFASVAKGAMLSGNSMLDSTDSPGRLVMGIVSLDPVNGDGVLAQVRFRVKAALGATAALKLEALRGWDNKSHAELLLTSQDGQIKVVSAGLAGLGNLGQYLPWLIAGGAVLVLAIVMMARGRRGRRDDNVQSPGAQR